MITSATQANKNKQEDSFEVRDERGTDRPASQEASMIAYRG